MTTKNLFHKVLAGDAVKTPPIWLMRQAGRYHAPYQQLRARHSFETLCREPELAAEVALGPIVDFDFDAAILFSDLLFPLEALGFGLTYEDGPPKLDGSLTTDRLRRFRPIEEALDRLKFQGAAMRATRALLPDDKGLIGFVGGPWTLFVYAVEGTHAGKLARAKASLDLYRAFADRMTPLLIENIRLQFDGGADIVMIFDTAAGELAPDVFQRAIAGDLAKMTGAFPNRLGYYAKGIRQEHLGVPFIENAAGLGYDMHWDFAGVLKDPARKGFAQGNFNPISLQLTGKALDDEIDRFLTPLRALDAEARRGWICGLGHGVLPGTPEESVRTFVKSVRRAFA
jgi:uroporphyrinogen decarboxylase